jgi:hypothetical protein
LEFENVLKAEKGLLRNGFTQLADTEGPCREVNQKVSSTMQEYLKVGFIAVANIGNEKDNQPQ